MTAGKARLRRYKRPAVALFFGGGREQGSVQQFEPQAAYATVKHPAPPRRCRFRYPAVRFRPPAVRIRVRSFTPRRVGERKRKQLEEGGTAEFAVPRELPALSGQQVSQARDVLGEGSGVRGRHSGCHDER